MTAIFDKLAVKRPTTRGTPEHKLITALREALKEYDRATKADGRRANGKRRSDGRFRLAVAVAAGLVREKGWSIRKAAAVQGVSYGAVWNALNQKGA